MDGKAVEKIQEMATAAMAEKVIDGLPYHIIDLKRVNPPLQSPLNVYTLEDISKVALDASSLELICHVESHTRVRLVKKTLDQAKQREVLAVADVGALVDNFKFDSYMDQEQFIIDLQTCFVPTETLKQVLECASRVSINDDGDFEDDGVSQTVTVKKGAAIRQKMAVPNPVLLECVRSFPELRPVAQPYVFRVKKDYENPKFALFQSKSRAWELETVEGIKKHLKTILPERVLIV